MDIRFTAARAISALSTWGLRTILHRPAANTPGKLALYADPSLIAKCRNRLDKGSIVVVGTNGKTTTSNLLANALEQAGHQVICNRTGANLDSGVATALLQARRADWGVFECDELWLAKVLPALQAHYVLLLNLFRDQLDRAGEIEIVQDAIARALQASPHTVLLYNADDPLCEGIAQRVDNPCIAFGVAQNMHVAQNTVSDAQVCQLCSGRLAYRYRQYGQLGDYYCASSECDFKRPPLQFYARDVVLEPQSLSFDFCMAAPGQAPEKAHFDVPLSGQYMVYNALALATAAAQLGCPNSATQQALRAFNPRNGRLERLTIHDRPVLINLAKNPTGLNQNLNIVLADEKPLVVGFFINDKEADGHDISWLWDVDFEQLAARPDIKVYAGGIRRNDVQLRLKYAGVAAELIDDAAQLMEKAASLAQGSGVYAISNYTALPAVQQALEALEGQMPPALTPTEAAHQEDDQAKRVIVAAARDEEPVVIVDLFPDLLNLYGDGGNAKVLEARLRWRGIPVSVKRIASDDELDFSQADLVCLGGGADREESLACKALQDQAAALRAFVEDDGPVLAICGGYQILGKQWLLGDESMPGLGILDVTTARAGSARNRFLDNIGLRMPGVQHVVVGFENHSGRTYLSQTAAPFGAVVSSTGHGNNDADKQDGAVYKQVIGTYLHGPLLGKNPEVADKLLLAALEHRKRRCGISVPLLISLDDTVELEANAYMAKRMGAH